MVKASAYKEGDLGSIPGSGRSPGEGNGNPLHILAWKIPWTEDFTASTFQFKLHSTAKMLFVYAD